jgi:hypothetical protein
MTPMQSVNDENDPPGNDAERNSVGALASSSLPTPSRAPIPAAQDDAPPYKYIDLHDDFSTLSAPPFASAPLSESRASVPFSIDTGAAFDRSQGFPPLLPTENTAFSHIYGTS